MFLASIAPRSFSLRAVLSLCIIAAVMLGTAPAAAVTYTPGQSGNIYEPGFLAASPIKGKGCTICPGSGDYCDCWDAPGLPNCGQCTGTKPSLSGDHDVSECGCKTGRNAKAATSPKMAPIPAVAPQTVVYPVQTPVRAVSGYQIVNGVLYETTCQNGTCSMQPATSTRKGWFR